MNQVLHNQLLTMKKKNSILTTTVGSLLAVVKATTIDFKATSLEE